MNVYRMDTNEQSKHHPPAVIEVRVLNENTPLKLHPHKSNIVVITGGPTVVANFGPEAQILKCPYCHNFVTTYVKSNASTKTHLFAAVLCMCCCWLCSCCPYIIDSCQDRNHYCPHCKALLGRYRC